MKILNLYAGIGGNRKFWGDEHQITAVELIPEIAKVYSELYQNDTVIIGDAHQYLIDHYKEFDFIWSSPPCPTHSRFNFLSNVQEGKKMSFPDMKLYEEIIFLKHFYKGKFCIENVISYYDPLIPQIKSSGHYFWTNFNFEPLKNEKRGIRNGKGHIKERAEQLGIDLEKLKDLKSEMKRKVLNNCCENEIGLHILKASL